MLAVDTPPKFADQGPSGPLTVGIVVAERLYAGLVQNGKLVGSVQTLPKRAPADDPDEDSPLVEFHTDALIEALCEISIQVADGQKEQIVSVGVALPGLVRNGVVEEAPNLPQLKGARMAEMLTHALRAHGLNATVSISNDADAIAAGLAATHGKLDSRIRVWTLGTGIGFGVYPFTEGVWENGHSIVTLDERENYCGCGGRGHLEGIMGHRAMRLRFLDMEPEEVFEAATRRPSPDARCAEFRSLWHRALAAATASSIYSMGAGRFYITGFNVRFLDLNLLRQHLHEMVKMSPLQSYQLEIVPEDQGTRLLGAAITAGQAVGAK